MNKNYTNKRVPEAMYNFESPGSGLKRWKPELVDDKNVVLFKSSTEVAIDIADYLKYERGIRLYWKHGLHYYSKKRGTILTVDNEEEFLRKRVKKKLKKDINADVIAEFNKILKEDVEGYWRSKLEKRDRSIVLLKNCWFDIGRCYSGTLSWGYVPGFQRWRLDVEMHEEPERPREIDEIKLVIGEVVSGYVLNAPVKWCDIKTGEMIEEMARTAYPYMGPIAYLNACSNTMDDFAKVVAADVVAVMIDGITLDTWTSAVRERVGLLVKAGIPTVVRADFLPIMPIGDDADSISKEITVVKRIDAPITNAEQFISDALYSLAWAVQMHVKHQEVEIGVFARPNPNDIPAMLRQFIKERLRLTKQECDVIFLQEILSEFKKYVNEAGGRGDNIVLQSLGIQIKKVIETRVENHYDKVKRKSRSALIGYIWIQ